MWAGPPPSANVNRVPAIARYGVDEVGIWRDRVLELSHVEAGRAKQLNADHLFDKGVAQVPDRDSHVASHATSKCSDAIAIENHIRIDLDEEWGLDLGCAGVQCHMKWRNAAHHNDVTHRHRLPMQTCDCVLRGREYLLAA
jgi:hypothetical protein